MTDVTDRRTMAKKLQKERSDLAERVKELNCLYGISRLIEKPGISLDEIFQGIINLIPPALQYPEIACARIIIEGKEYRMRKCRKDPAWEWSFDIIVHGKKAGYLYVCYPKKIPGIDTTPFLKEEETLLNAVAERLGGIIERKKAEDELRLHSVVMVNMDEGVYLIRLDNGIIVYANPKFEKMFGYNPGEIIGRHVSIVNDPADKHPEETAKEVMEILNETGEWHGEIRNIKKDGTPFRCFANVSVFNHPEYGRVLISIHTDITERKKAENALRESEEKFRTIFNQARDGFLLISENSEIVEFNDAAHNNLGYTRAEFKQLKVADIDLDESSDDVRGRMRKIVRDGSSFFEVRHRTKSGEIRNVMVSGQIVEIKERKLFSSIWCDITERKKAEEEIRKLNEKLKTDVEEKTVLLKEIDHRVKNNFQFLSSLLSLQKRSLKGEKIKKELGEAQKRVDSMARAYDHLRKSANLSGINLHNYINELVRDLACSYNGGITYKVDIDKKFLFNVGATLHCGLIINELVTNSLKYAFPEGKGKIYVSMKPYKDEIELLVRDDGIGLPEDVDIKTCKSFGLSIVNILATMQLDGDIKVNRKNGTEYKIRFKRKMRGGIKNGKTKYSDC